MQYKTKLLTAISCTFLFYACTKSDTNYQASSASLNVINATANLGTVKVNFTSPGSKGGMQLYSQITQTVGYGSNFNYPILAGQSVPVTIVATSDTTNPVVNTQLNLSNTLQYSMYLAGTKAAMDTILLQDPYLNHTDSSCGVRFINLSSNSQPVYVTLAISDSIKEFTNLGYKQITDYKTYPSIVATPSYKFNIWNAANDSLLTTYTLTTPYFHNVTLALIGLQGGSPAFSVARINNY